MGVRRFLVITASFAVSAALGWIVGALAFAAWVGFKYQRMRGKY